ncbi:hypothetical protein [Thermococcus atlanticus]
MVVVVLLPPIHPLAITEKAIRPTKNKTNGTCFFIITTPLNWAVNNTGNPIISVSVQQSIFKSMGTLSGH